MTPPNGPLAGRRVLIVEDEALIAIAVDEEIQSLGSVETYIAYNRQHALEAIADFKPDFAVLDISLTGDGVDYAVADTLAHNRVPFVFSSGHVADECPDRHKSRPFVGKPMQSQDFADAVERALL